MRQKLITIILTYLRFLARLALKRHKPLIIGVAGSVGKSSTRNALYAMLKDVAPTRMVGNSETGIPLGILGITPAGYSSQDWLRMLKQALGGIEYLKGTKYLIAEMGIDEPYPPKNMEYLLTILKPDIAISLNATAAHTEQFEKVLSEPNAPQFNSEKEKYRYILSRIALDDTKIITESGCEVGIFNADDEYVARTIESQLNRDKQSNNPTPNLLSFGEGKRNAISYLDQASTLEGSTFRFQLNGEKIEKISLTFKKQLFPAEYQELFAATMLVGKRLGLTNTQITSNLEKNYTLPKSRSTMFSGIRDSIIIDSSYNSSKPAMFAFLQLLAELGLKHRKKKALVMGDMRELGHEAKMEHEEVAEMISESVEYLYCIGPLTKQFVVPYLEKKKEKITKEVMWFPSSIDAGKYLAEHLPENSIVLVKGSQNTLYLEEAIKYLLKNKEDEKNLCRQEGYWKETKQKYFATPV
jgi:UDP-N-acetylmuramoyl-tripeptide--D-alanyl-D-alanine ligase